MKSSITYTLILSLFLITSVTSCKKGPADNIGKTVTINIPHHPLTNEKDLDILINEIGDARVVLLGEASHGTEEYYTWRAAISKRLIEEKGFDFIAVEGEWADSYRVNNFIKGPRQDSLDAVEILKNYNRWPTWMWGNYQVASLANWLNNHNQSLPPADKVGFFGLDVYCLWESMTELMPYVQGRDTAIANAATRVHNCFQPFSADAQEYAYAVAGAGEDCRQQTSYLWDAITKVTGSSATKTEADFVMEQNALVALNAEKYYRSMLTGGQASWNIRDQHMMQTLKRLLDFHGQDSKAIVWEHNTHVGDARYTDMAAAGMLNVGQLARTELGEENVFIVGFGSYQGTVIAAEIWGAGIQTMEVPAAMVGSWEQILHSIGETNKLILSREISEIPLLTKPINHRAIGVVYNPTQEQGNYVPSTIPKRYDAVLYIDKTRALSPIAIPLVANQPPDLYPSGSDTDSIRILIFTNYTTSGLFFNLDFETNTNYI